MMCAVVFHDYLLSYAKKHNCMAGNHVTFQERFMLNMYDYVNEMLQYVWCLSVGAQACVVAFSTVDRDSFDAVTNWLQKVNK